MSYLVDNMDVKITLLILLENFIRLLLLIIPAPYYMKGGKKVRVSDVEAEQYKNFCKLATTDPSLFQATRVRVIHAPFSFPRVLLCLWLNWCLTEIEHIRMDGYMYILTGTSSKDDVIRTYNTWSRIAFGRDGFKQRGQMSLDDVETKLVELELTRVGVLDDLKRFRRAKKRLSRAEGTVYDVSSDRVLTFKDQCDARN